MQTGQQQQSLDRHLHQLLGELEAPAMALLHQQLEWVSLVGGQTLISQGEPGDSMYLVISGRLRAYVQGEEGGEQQVREMARGEVIGEMSLYTDGARSATVVAIRDSTLVRLGKQAFQALLASSPRLSLMLTRQIIHRLQNPQFHLARPVAIALLPISAGVDAQGLARQLAAKLALNASVCIVDAASVDLANQQPGLAASAPGDVQAAVRIAAYLDDVEARHDYVLLLTDETPGAWTQRCCRRCDEMLLLADASQAPVLHPTEREHLMQREARAEARETLVLLHPADSRSPKDTRQWLNRRPLSGHLHIRPALERDIERLARFQSRTAVGLVLAGGGARGIAHLGIFRALQERGIEVDYVGGTSIGSVMAALVAMDRPLTELMTVARKSFSVNPTSDYNLLPMISLIAGRKMRQVLDSAVRQLQGFNGDLEDLWKSYYCVASNYSKGGEHLITRGNLTQAIRASSAIPGALPPVLSDGDLLCDGGTFNNFPVDVMRRMAGIGKVIGVDLSFRKPKRIELDEVPGSWALLRDRFRAWPKRRFRLPSLVSYLMNISILYSTSRQRQSQRETDLYFNPPLERVGMLQWAKFDNIVEQGYAHAGAVLAELPEATLQGFRDCSEPRLPDVKAPTVN